MSTPHNSRTFRHRREVVIYFHNYRCQLCGQQSLSLEVHHDNRNENDHSWQNLVPLHKHCHRQVHKTNMRFRLEHFPLSYFT